ncbi:MAG: citrate synthase, partial [Anaerolineae bacterium]|nr:citrate synthase [Anaerolineae bacterium]
ITLIDNGKLYYRGKDVVQLVRQHSIEQVAALIWTGDMAKADILFDVDIFISAQKYETMLLHLELDGAELTPLQELQTFLPAAAADDRAAYDLRPASVSSVGARIMRLMTSVLAGDVPENLSIATMLQHGWCPNDEQSKMLFNATLIIMADHELNSSSFAARVVASAGSTPYAAVLAGLSALQGIKHGGSTARIEAFLNEIYAAEKMRDTIAARLRRGDVVPGFGHKLYPDGDPRAQLILDLLNRHYDTPELQRINAAIAAVKDLVGDSPNVDTTLVMMARILNLPQGSPLALFALGRTIGWIGHAIEQYERDRLIRPRARYIGEHPTK